MATTMSGFAPAGWKLERQVGGDLDGDGRADAVAVLKGDDPTCVIRTDGPSNRMDTNPRLLLVAFGTGAGFRLAVANTQVIPRVDDPYMDDPFNADGLEIREGVLRVALTYWRSMGGWSTYSSTLSFRWNGRAFRMIGFDRESLQRNSGLTKSMSVNFLTGRAKLISGSMDDDVADVVKWRRVRPNSAPELDRMGDGLAFEPPLLNRRD